MIELEGVIRRDRERHAKSRKGIEYGEMTVFQGLGDKTVVGTFKMGDGRIYKVGTEEAA